MEYHHSHLIFIDWLYGQSAYLIYILAVLLITYTMNFLFIENIEWERETMTIRREWRSSSSSSKKKSENISQIYIYKQIRWNSLPKLKMRTPKIAFLGQRIQRSENNSLKNDEHRFIYLLLLHLFAWTLLHHAALYSRDLCVCFFFSFLFVTYLLTSHTQKKGKKMCPIK